jgi:hypothetical protein
MMEEKTSPVNLSQVISAKLMSNSISKLCVLDVGFSSAVVASLAATAGLERKKSLCFVICSTEQDKAVVRLHLSGHPDYLDHSIDNTKKVRSKNYQTGGIFLITRMKFVLDVLEQLVDPQLVDRVLLVNEHEVSSHSPLALAVNVLKRSNNVTKFYLGGLSDGSGERHLQGAAPGAVPVDDGQPVPDRLPVLAGVPAGGEGVPEHAPGRFGSRQSLVQEVWVREQGRLEQHLGKLVDIMKSLLLRVKNDFQEKTGQLFPLMRTDLTEMSNSEFSSSLSSVPVNYTNHMLDDLMALRRLLAAFEHPWRTKVLTLISSFKRGLESNYGKYNGFYTFGNKEKDIFDDFVDEFLEEFIIIRSDSKVPEYVVHALQSFASEDLKLERKFDTFSHSIEIKFRRMGKLEELLRMMRELGDSGIQSESESKSSEE